MTIFGAVTATTLLFALAIPSTFLQAEPYQGYASAVQAFGVILALLAAVTTLVSDAHDRRVERVIALHIEFTTGRGQEARLRLWSLLQKNGRGSPFHKPTLQDLRTGQFKCYGTENASNGVLPIEDLNVLLRIFERTHAMRTARVLDENLLHRLLGRHILWWNHLINPTHGEPMERPLKQLADWANEFDGGTAGAETREMWKQTIAVDFPDDVQQEPMKA